MTTEEIRKLELEVEKIKYESQYKWNTWKIIVLFALILCICVIMYCGLLTYLTFDHINKAIVAEEKTSIESKADGNSNIYLDNVGNIIKK